MVNEPLTLRGYESVVRVHLIPSLGTIQLDKLTGPDVQRCLNKAIERGVSPTTVRNINAALKSALTTAKEKWKYVDRNVAEDATIPKRTKYHAKTLSVEQAERLLAVVAGDRYEAMFHFALLMGLRRGEVLGVRWQDVDFVKGKLHVRQSLQRIPRRGVVSGSVKSETSDRTLSLPKVCLDALHRRQIIQQQECIKAGSKWICETEDFVLTSRYGVRLQMEEPSIRLNEALEAARLPHIRFHDLRHSTASLLVAKGVPMKVVQEILGHASYQITADTYSHLMPNAIGEAMQTMDELFDQNAKPVPTGAQTGVKRDRPTIQ